MVCFFLSFGFSLVLPAFLFVPVHVRKRGDPLKPATVAQFFDRLRPRWNLRRRGMPYDDTLSTR